MDSGSVRPPQAVAGPFRLEPFRGIALAPHRIGDPASARAFARPYRDVAARLRRWERQGNVASDPEPALYVHEYTADGLTVRGLVGALDVSRRAECVRDRVVLPHEVVQSGQAEELASRMAQMQMNPAPILLVHRGPAGVRALVHQVVEGAPQRDFVDRAERHNRVWPIRDPELLAGLREHLAGSRALIADGHHRFAAYLRLQEARPGSAADRGLAMLVDQDDTPLFLGAIHRTVPDTGLDELAEAASGIGELVPATAEEALAALGPTTMVLTDGSRWARLEIAPRPGRAAVETLHEELLPRLPGRPRRVAYHHSLDEALAGLRRRRVAVLMPAPDFDLVDRIVTDQRLLPEKATSFQPKPSLGVLMRSLRDG